MKPKKTAWLQLILFPNWESSLDRLNHCKRASLAGDDSSIVGELAL